MVVVVICQGNTRGLSLTISKLNDMLNSTKFSFSIFKLKIAVSGQLQNVPCCVWQFWQKLYCYILIFAILTGLFSLETELFFMSKKGSYSYKIGHTVSHYFKTTSSSLSCNFIPTMLQMRMYLLKISDPLFSIWESYFGHYR